VTNVFLGIIAVAVLLMAVIQVGALIFAIAAVRRVGEAVDRMERDLRPIVENLKALTADVARASELTVAQIERADRLFGDVSRRLEQVLSFLPGVLGPAGKGVAFVGGLKAVIAVVREVRRMSRSRKRPARSDGGASFTG